MIGFQSGEAAKVDSTKFQSELKQSLIEDGIADTILGRFAVVTAALPPTEEEFRQVVRLHGELMLKSLSKRGASQFVVKDWNPFLEAMTKEFFRAPMQNRIVHTLLDSYVRTVILHKTLEEMRAKTKGENRYELVWTGKGFEAKVLPALDCKDVI